MARMGRPANPDIRAAFAEFNDGDASCPKVRCLHCGYMRAKNTTRQIEHLQECAAYQASPEAKRAIELARQQEAAASSNPNASSTSTPSRGPAGGIFTGQSPNPNLIVHRRGPRKRKYDSGDSVPTPNGRGMPPPPSPSAKPTVQPSLTNHLLSRDPAALTAATQSPFLSHAGSGTLSAAALNTWLAQDAYISRGYIGFVGGLIAKIRLPATAANTPFHPLYRAVDLLISALNNVRREMSFFDITATKYNLQIANGEATPPSQVTRAYLDLFVACAAPAASLLEGLVVLWATQHCYRAAWGYAASASNPHSTHPPSSSNPSSHTSFPGGSFPMNPNLLGHNNESHIAALHQSLIPNWTSPAFGKFVEATKSVVDELAMAQTSGNGREEMGRCEGAFRQVLWLWEGGWPGVEKVGERDEGVGERRAESRGSGRGNSEEDAAGDDDVVEIVHGPRREGQGSYVSPYVVGAEGVGNA